MQLHAATVMLLLAAIAAPALGAQSKKGALCGSLFSAEELAPEVSSALIDSVDDLIRLKSAIDAMIDGTDKTIVIRDFQVKAREIARLVGPGFKQLFDERSGVVSQSQAREAQAQKNAKKKEQAVRQKEADILLTLSRFREHTEVQAAGPWLDEKHMVVFTAGDGLKVYDFKKRKFVANAAIDQLEEHYPSHKSSIALSPDKKNLVITLSERGCPKSIDLDTGKVTKLPFLMPNDGVRGFKFSKSGKELFIAGEKGENIIYSFAKKKVIFDLKKGGEYARGQEIIQSPDERWVFFIRGDKNHVLVNLQTGKEKVLPELVTPFHYVYDAAFSSDSKIITLVNHNQLYLDYNIATGKLGPSRIKAQGGEFHVSGDGKYLAVTQDIGLLAGDDNPPVQLFDLATGAELPIDLSKFKFERPSGFVFNETRDALIFVDTFREPGKKAHEENLYRLTFANQALTQFPQNPDNDVFSIVGTSPDGRSVVAEGNGGPMQELY